MFKKRNRNFRGRRKDSGSDHDGDSNTNNTSTAENDESSNTGSEVIVIPDEPETTIPVKKPKKKKEKDKPIPKSSSVLSFEHDEGIDTAEAFKIKKSSHSKRVAKQLKKELLKEKEEQHSRATPPISAQYDPKSLQELRDAQNVNNGCKVPSPGPGSDIDFTDEEEETGPNFNDMIKSGVIPDANMIHEIRKRRQLAREHGEFIPLDDTVKVDNDKSRLVREDDNDLSDEEGARMDFTVGSNREAELRNIQKTIIQANDESHSDESEHEWERQQIRKGVGIPTQVEDTMSQDGSAYMTSYGNSVMATSTEVSGFHMGGMPQAFAGGTGKRTIQVADLPTISLSLIHKRLVDRLDEMKTVQRTHENEREDLASRLSNSLTIVEDSSGRKRDLENQYRFYQETRGYVTDLVECLNEKVPKINHLEKSLLKLWQKRAEKIVERRQQDVKDESKDCLQSLDKTKPLDPNSLDQSKQRRIAEREARRNRRRRQRDAKGTAAKHEEGMSTDDEQNPSELAHYNSEKDRITMEAERLFEDVESDFCELDAIKSHFERWREEQGESYHEAYIALCLPKLFTPFVKLKLLDWNPLTSGTSVNLTLQEWYETLMFYGYKRDRQIEKSDDDVKVLPNIVEKVIVPKITVLVETVWDPMSSVQTKNLVTSLMHFVSSYPTLTAESKHTKALIKAVVGRMRKTLDDDVFMPLYPKAVLETKGVAQSFFQRQFWQGYKLLTNILLWNDLVEQPALREMALDALLNRYILLGLQNSPLSEELLLRCQLIAGKFPKAWFNEVSESDSTLPQMEPFCRFLMQLARNLYEQAEKSNRDFEKRQARENIKKIAKILVNIHAMDHSMDLANHYSVKLQQI